MPFTFCHPAIILPFSYFSKRHFSMTALIIGSISPDFEYFLRMKIQSEYSHTLLGLCWFNLPMGLSLAFLFHNIVRNQFIYHCPIFIQKRLFSFTEFSWNLYFKQHWFVVLYSLLLGAISHVFWDSFTHSTGYFVGLIPILQTKIILFNHSLFIFKILQHGSTLIGGIIILTVIFRLKKSEITIQKNMLLYWGSILGLTSLIFGIRFCVGLTIHQYGHIIVSLIASFLFSLLLISIIFKKKKSLNSY